MEPISVRVLASVIDALTERELLEYVMGSMAKQGAPVYLGPKTGILMCRNGSLSCTTEPNFRARTYTWHPEG